jgi:hypothetical protein
MSTTVGGVGIAGAAILVLAYLLLVKANPNSHYATGVGRGGIVLAAMCGGALPLFTSLAGTGWSLFGTLAAIAQSLAQAANGIGGAG